MVMMHRQILGISGCEEGDHINGNGLDNRRANLRRCTRQQNSWNKPARRLVTRRPTSRYKGVSWDKARCKWRAELRTDGVIQLHKRFDSEIEAARAYDAAARFHFGEFAFLNFPDAEEGVEAGDA